MWILPLLIITLAIVLSLAYLIDEVNQPELRGTLTLEAGNPLPSPKAFLTEDSGTEISYVTELTDRQLITPGEYEITLKCGGKNRSAKLRVVDTVPPSGTVQDLTVTQANMPSASDFVTQVQDATAVTVSYLTEPDRNNSQPQTVTVVLTDAGGNVTRLSATLTVLIDREAPVITGVSDIVAYTGDTVAYRSGVAVSDNMDAAPSLTVDSSAVDLSPPGGYQVIYRASEASGNVTAGTATVTVYEKQESYAEIAVIYEAADKILADIISNDMTDRQKVQAIYSWVVRNCGYVNHSEKDNWVQAAYRMLKDRQGDCFNYFSLCKLMLERLHIPNIDVVKVPNYDGDSNHYWSLVSVDGGQTYYHLDTTPRKGDGDYFCLVTDKVMDTYSASHGNCFNRDKSLYPATPEE